MKKMKEIIEKILRTKEKSIKVAITNINLHKMKNIIFTIIPTNTSMLYKIFIFHFHLCILKNTLKLPDNRQTRAKTAILMANI